MCICGISIMSQMAVLNCYHVYPLREIPGWIKRMQKCMCSTMTKAPESQQNNRLPFPNENAHSDNRALANKNPAVNNKHTEGKEREIEALNVTSGIDVMTEKIKSDEEDEKLRLEWRKLARLFDRLLFYIFGTIHFLMILFIFVAIPYTWSWLLSRKRLPSSDQILLGSDRGRIIFTCHT